MSLDDIQSSLEAIKVTIERQNTKIERLDTRLEKLDARTLRLEDIYDKCQKAHDNCFSCDKLVLEDISTSATSIFNSSDHCCSSKAVINPTLQSDAGRIVAPAENNG